MTLVLVHPATAAGATDPPSATGGLPLPGHASERLAALADRAADVRLLARVLRAQSRLAHDPIGEPPT